ncbi:hypothetical protein Scep_019737 [Stephania cephalantha]|uniref:alpha-1,2-Mannosidase n=1 Tax=Stephania cephalantha TaxID=152367 RepID=A0AAP0IBR2_9MAGN
MNSVACRCLCLVLIVLLLRVVCVPSFPKLGEFQSRSLNSPQSKDGVNSFGGLGATLIDSLDTLCIMGLDEQFQKAKEWVATSFDFNKNYDASIFETTIRLHCKLWRAAVAVVDWRENVDVYELVVGPSTSGAYW